MDNPFSMGDPIEIISYKNFSGNLFDRSFDLQKPFRGQIELTYRCNLHCVHCYTDCFNNSADIKKEMTTDMIFRLIDEIHDAGCLWLCFTGGEIFMRKDFFEIYGYAKKKGFLISLFTNMTGVDESIVNQLAENPPFVIETSCHGVGETFDRITQVAGSFERFDSAIRLFLRHGLQIRVKTKAMTLNRGELGKIKTYIESLGLEFGVSTDIQPDLKGSSKTTAYSLTPKEIVALEIQGRTCETLGKPNPHIYHCGCGSNSFLIGAHGKLASCVFSRQFEEDLRCQPFQQSLEVVFLKVRSAVFLGNSPCRDCKIMHLCDKKPGMMHFNAQNPEEPSKHFCETAHLKAEKLGLLITT